MVSFGPDYLGRGLVVRPGEPVPDLFAAVPRLRLDAAALARPHTVVTTLQDAWFDRRRIVVELALPAATLKVPEETQSPPYELGPEFEFTRERIHFFTWANNYDATRGEPVWWHGRIAERLGARAASPEDVVLPSGRRVYCDGGPRMDLPVPVVHRESLELNLLTVTEAGRAPADGLAPDQLLAVQHQEGAARIIAPAGSGKTRVLTERLRHLLTDRHFERDLVTAVCYNKRAAEELKGRTRAFKPRVHTLHALGYAILNRLKPCEVLQEMAVRQLLRPLVSIDLQANQDPLASWLEALSQVRIGLVSPAEVERGRDDVVDFAQVFRRYRTLLSERGAVDHDEQIYGAIEVLLRQPTERRYWQRQCRHLLVDEFQDLTPAYLLLIRLLSAPAYQVFGVGDDDQVIYGYLGATPDYLIRYGSYFPRARHYALNVNYRCPVPVVRAASTLLSHNQRRVPKSIQCGLLAVGDSAALRQQTGDSGDLAGLGLKAIAGWLAEGVAASDIAVLTRVNTSLLPIQVCLLDASLPCRTAVTTTLLSRTGIRCALTYIRMGLSSPNWRREDILETIRRPARKISRAVSDRLAPHGTWTERELHRLGAGLQRWEADRLEEYLDDLRKVAASVHRNTTLQVLRLLRSQIGLDQALQTLDTSASDGWTASHIDDLKALEQVAALHPEVATFETWLHDWLRVKGEEGVTLSTIHRVKGMEWPYVLLLDVSEGLLPHRLSDDIEEERRIFHVALTRAKTKTPACCFYRIEVVRPRFSRSFNNPIEWGPGGAPKATPAGVLARVGLRLEALGQVGRITEIQPEYILLQVASGARLTVKFGERVTAGGISGPLRQALVEPVEEVVDAFTQRLFDDLKQWRRDMAEEQGVPAYAILKDKHLLGVARAAPGSLSQLARCKGIGPARLEAYGDQLLARIEVSLCQR